MTDQPINEAPGEQENIVNSILSEPEIVEYTPPLNVNGNHTARTNGLLFSGMLGFFVVCFLLFNDGFYYQDVNFNPRDIGMQILAKSQRQLRDSLQGDTAMNIPCIAQKLARCADTAKTCRPSKSKVLYCDTTPKDRAPLRRALRYFMVNATLRRLAYPTDTSFSQRFLINRLYCNKDALMRLYTPETSPADLPLSIPFTFNQDSTAGDFSVLLTDTITLNNVSYKGRPISFYAKYPNFGVWALLLIIHFTACFIVVPLTCITIYQVWSTLGKKHSIQSNQLWRDLAITTGLVAVFGVTLTRTVFNQMPFRMAPFVHGYGPVYFGYVFLSGLSAIVCLTGFLYTARILTKMLQDIKSTATTHSALLLAKNSFPRATAFAGAKAGYLQASIDNANSNIQVLSDEYLRLRKYFSIFFNTSAFLLSLMVLKLGALFSAIGSLDLVRYLAAGPLSRIFIRPDCIYLSGGIVSILLLLFYIPVKVSMTNLQNSIPDLGKVAPDDSGGLSIFSSGLKNFAGVFAASSPLLLSLIQSLADALSHH